MVDPSVAGVLLYQAGRKIGIVFQRVHSIDLFKTDACSGIIRHEKRLNFFRDTKEVDTGRTLEGFCEIG